MKRPFTGFILFFAALGYAHAQSDVYLCIDEHGNREYKNTGATKGCKKVELPGITTIPAPPRAAAQPAASKASSPADFPKVDSTAQKARDNDRKQILQDEMRIEEQKLAELKKEFNNGEPERRGDERNYAKYQARLETLRDEVARTERNVEALKREIGNLK